MTAHHQLEQAIAAAGSAAELAREIGVTPQRLSAVRTRLGKGGPPIPWRWAVKIEEKYQIPKSSLRPDIWGNEAAP